MRKLQACFSEMPSEATIIKRSVTHPEWYKPIKALHGRKRSEEAARRAKRQEEILRRLKDGETLQDLIRARVVGRSMLDKWRLKDLLFDAAVRDAVTDRHRKLAEKRAKRDYDDRTKRLVRREQERQRRLGRANLQIDPIYAAADKAVPRSYPTAVREDIVSSIFLAVLEGELQVDQIHAQAKRFVTAYWRDRPEFHAISFDAPVSREGGRMTLHEVIAQPAAAE